MDPLLPRLEDEERRRRRRLLFRHNKIPVRMLVPNFFTLLSLCAGLTAIRMAIEQRYEYGHRAGRHRRPARRRRRPPGARAQGAVQVRRRARQPGRLRQLRRGAGGDRVHLGPRRPAARLRLDRRRWCSRWPWGCGSPASTPCSRWRSRSGSRTTSPACRRRPAPSRCCCRSISTASACSTCAAWPWLIALYTLAMAAMLVSTIPTFSGKLLGERISREYRAADLRRRGRAGGAARHLPLRHADAGHAALSGGDPDQLPPLRAEAREPAQPSAAAEQAVPVPATAPLFPLRGGERPGGSGAAGRPVWGHGGNVVLRRGLLKMTQLGNSTDGVQGFFIFIFACVCVMSFVFSVVWRWNP